MSVADSTINIQGIINRATLVEKLGQAFVTIGDILPRSNLSAELYQTDHMKETLSRLYAYIILFLQLCVKWYNRSSLGRLVSVLKSPFELDYQYLVEQIKLSSAAVEDVANAGARVEIRDIRIIQDLHHAQSMKSFESLLDRQTKFEEHMRQLLQVATSSNTLTQRISIDVGDISKTVYRLEFHQIVEFLAPAVPPQAALLKVQSFTRRNPTTSLPSLESLKTKRMLANWASADQSSLLVIRVDLRTQKHARDIAADTIHVLASQSQCVFWNLSLPHVANEDNTMVSAFKALAHQVLQHSPELFAEFAEQLNLTKMHGTHTDSEWADLICLLLSKQPQAFVVLETGSLHKAYRNDPDWAARLLKLMQRVAEKATAAGNQLKILILMHGKVSIVPHKSSEVYEVLVTSLSLPASTPSQLRRAGQRSRLSMKRRRHVEV
jgi:hypothetical protein